MSRVDSLAVGLYSLSDYGRSLWRRFHPTIIGFWSYVSLLSLLEYLSPLANIPD